MIRFSFLEKYQKGMGVPFVLDRFKPVEYLSIILAISIIIFAAAIGLFLVFSHLPSLLFFLFFSIALAASLYRLPSELLKARIGRMEAELPKALSLVVAEYRVAYDMLEALNFAGQRISDPLKSELIFAVSESRKSQDPEKAFRKLTELYKSNYLNRTFELIVENIVKGTEVTSSLKDIANDISITTAQRKEKQASVSVFSFVILIGTVLFLPGMASFGLVLGGFFSSSFSAGLNPEESGMLAVLSLICVALNAVISSFVLGELRKESYTEGKSYVPSMLFLSVAVFYISGEIVRALLV